MKLGCQLPIRVLPLMNLPSLVPTPHCRVHTSDKGHVIVTGGLKGNFHIEWTKKGFLHCPHILCVCVRVCVPVCAPSLVGLVAGLAAAGEVGLVAVAGW